VGIQNGSEHETEARPLVSYNYKL